MESILISFVTLVLIIVSTVTLTMNSINSAAKLSDSWKAMQEKTNSIRRTEIVSIPPQTYNGGIIDLVVKNSGQANVVDFAHWDVIVEVQDGWANSLTYSANYPPGNNQWALKGIFVSDNVAEVFDLNILNPGEQIVVGINPGETVIEEGKTVKITLSTAEGVTTQCFVTAAAP
jgi:hypothetical protein